MYVYPHLYQGYVNNSAFISKCFHNDNTKYKCIITMPAKIHVLIKHVCLNSTFNYFNATEDRPVVNFPHQLNPLSKCIQISFAYMTNFIYTIYYKVASVELYNFSYLYSIYFFTNTYSNSCVITKHQLNE